MIEVVIVHDGLILILTGGFCMSCKTSMTITDICINPFTRFFGVGCVAISSDLGDELFFLGQQNCDEIAKLRLISYVSNKRRFYGILCKT